MKLDHWKESPITKDFLLSYSVSVGVVITALSHLLYKQGGELVLWPGIFVQVMLNGFLLLFVGESDNFYSVPSGTHLLINAVFYSAAVFIIGAIGSARR